MKLVPTLDLEKAKVWTKRIYTVLVLNAELPSSDPLTKEIAICAKFRLSIELDEHYQMNHSLMGHGDIGLMDVMLFSFFRRAYKIYKLEDIEENEYFFECENLQRVLTHIWTKYLIGYKAMDTKEE
jgi:hypothetical protein